MREIKAVVSGIFLLILLVLSAGFVTTPASAGTGICARATVGEPFILPDGSRHPAGMLTLCHDGSFNPVSSFHSTFVNRMPVARFTSHHETVQPSEGSDYALLFARADDRQLRLIGYTLPSRDGAETHMLDRPRVTVKQYLDSGTPVTERAIGGGLISVPATLD